MDENKNKVDDRIISPAEMEQLLGKHRRTIINWSERGEFPPRVKLPGKGYGWFESSYNGWLADRRGR